MRSEDRSFAATTAGNKSISYRTYIPKDYSEEGIPFPLLFFMHGAGEIGTDLDLLERATLPRFIREGLELPFVTVCPQCQEMWDVRILEPLLDEVIERFNVDAARVYVTGSSMGGLGTWMLCNVASDRVAAIAPVCPSFIPVDPENFKRLPVWVFHGAMDSVVPIEETDRMVALLRNAGCEVKFTEYRDLDHNAWTPAYHDPELWQWLLSHRKA